MRTEVGKDLADIRGKSAELVEKKVAAEDQLKRIDIRAPQSGMVHQLDVHTVGGVISAGQQIMLIVPAADKLIVEAVKAGDDPAAVAQAVVAAATDTKPKLRYPAGSRAGMVSTMRRVVPSRAFDRQIRKMNQLAG